MPVYQFKPGYIKARAVDAQAAGQAIERLPEKTPEAVVSAAQRPTSPLHGAFTWENDEAAEKWRIREARDLLGHLVVISERADQAPVRAFVSVKSVRAETPSKRMYVSIDEALTDPEFRASFIEDAYAEYFNARQKYRMLNELAIIHDAIDRAMQEHDQHRKAG